MTTVTLKLKNEKAIDLLKDLEALDVVELYIEKPVRSDEERIASIKSLKGKMTKQPIEEIERQLADFRAE